MTVIKLIHQLLISILLFTLWAGFALFIVNPIYNADLPGYQIGSICIWEYFAMIIAIIISFMITKYWGYPQIIKKDRRKKLVLSVNYGYFFLAYFLLGFTIAIWQFWIFSQTF